MRVPHFKLRNFGISNRLASRRPPTNDHQSLTQWTAMWDKSLKKFLLAVPEDPFSLDRPWTGSLASVDSVALVARVGGAEDGTKQARQQRAC